MKFFNINILLTIIGLITATSVFASPEKDFAQVWSSIKNDHPELKSTMEDKLASDEGASRAFRHWLPSVYLMGRGYATNDPLMNFMGNLGQRSITNTDFSPSSLNQPGTSSFAQFGIGANLPLFEGGSSSAMLKMQELDAQGKSEIYSAKQIEVYSQAILSYAGILNSTEAISEMELLKGRVAAVLSRYSLGSRSNPVGYSGLLGLKSILNRIEAGLIQLRVEKNTHASELRSRSKDLSSEWSVKSEKTGRFLSLFLPESAIRSNSDSHSMVAANARAESMASKVTMKRAMFLPQVGLFADGNYLLGDRSGASSYVGGVYLRWSLFDPKAFGAVSEERHLKNSAEFQVQNSRINENNMRIASEASLVAILESEKILLSSTELMNEQVSTATKLFQSGAINALQLVEVLNRRADLILDLKKLNDSHIAVRTGLAKISNLKGIEL